MVRKKAAMMVLVVACVVMISMIGVAGCSPQASDGTVGDAKEPQTTGSVELSESDRYEPIIKTLDDGTQIQRTPDDGAITLDGSYTYHSPTDGTVPYNTYYLKADKKGCNACHDDLAEKLNAMQYEHVDLTSSLDIQVTVQMCKDCHTFGYGYLTNQNSFGSLIHGIHEDLNGQGDCWSCHVATGEGKDMQLWDEAKHTQLRGITPVADVAGDFSFNQDRVLPADELFDFGWEYFEWDYTRADNGENNVPLDEKMFDTWTITFSGEVAEEKTYTLPQLIEEFGTIEVDYTLHCTLNPTGGPLLGNNTYTAIPLSKVLQAVGMSEDAGAITAVAPDGFIESVQMSNFTEAYLAIEIDGEPLSWEHGYPVQLIVPGSGAPASVKEVSDIIVNSAEEALEIHEWNGWPIETDDPNYYTPSGWPMNDENGYINKPNVGLFATKEGQIIKTGEPYTFTGYAAAWDETIAALEFSMDGGATWTRYETPGVDRARWVIWEFTYTPEEDSAYVLYIRSVTAQGSVTPEPIEIMVNAKSN